jgi:hypothetical protein
MRWLCAWCNAALPEAQRDRDDNVTHGICLTHLEAWKAELLAMRRAKEGATT